MTYWFFQYSIVISIGFLSKSNFMALVQVQGIKPIPSGSIYGFNFTLTNKRQLAKWVGEELPLLLNIEALSSNTFWEMYLGTFKNHSFKSKTFHPITVPSHIRSYEYIPEYTCNLNHQSCFPTPKKSPMPREGSNFNFFSKAANDLQRRHLGLLPSRKGQDPL